jgi:hypothetical protein
MHVHFLFLFLRLASESPAFGGALFVKGKPSPAFGGALFVKGKPSPAFGGPRSGGWAGRVLLRESPAPPLAGRFLLRESPAPPLAGRFADRPVVWG